MLIYNESLFMFKILNSHDSVEVLSFPQVGQTHERNTRQIHNLQVPRTRTKFADRALSIRGPTQWNKLPATIKHETRMTQFKKKLKEYML